MPEDFQELGLLVLSVQVINCPSTWPPDGRVLIAQGVGEPVASEAGSEMAVLGN